MFEGDEMEGSGRKGLFAVTGKKPEKKGIIPEDVLEQSVSVLATLEEEEPDLPSIFEPVVFRLKRLLGTIKDQNEEILRLNELYTTLETDLNTLRSTHDSYLNDLITAHTEFDRALEIFQYHELAMVLTDTDGAIHDANEAFCDLFGVSRSEITTSHPPASQYLPYDEPARGPDGRIYSVISIRPPILPFDHDVSTLLVLVEQSLSASGRGYGLSGQGGEPERPGFPRGDPAAVAFDLFPVASAVLDAHGTIRMENLAFVSLTGRDRSTVHLRDIGSCGFGPEVRSLGSLEEADMPLSMETEIMRYDGATGKVWLEVNSLGSASDNPYFLLVCVETDSDAPDGQIESPDGSDAGQTGDHQLARVLLDMNPAPAALYSRDLKIFASNESFAEIMGLSSSDLTGSDLVELGIPADISASGPILLDRTITFDSPWGRGEYSVLIIPGGSDDDLSVLILQDTSSGQPGESRIPLNIPPAPAVNPRNEEYRAERQVPGTDMVGDSHVARVLLDMSPAPTALFSSGHRIYAVNESFAEIMGLSSADLAGSDLAELGISTDVSSSDPVLLEKAITIDSPWGRGEYSVLIIPAPSPGGLSVLILQSTAEDPATTADKGKKSEMSPPASLGTAIAPCNPDLSGLIGPGVITDSDERILLCNDAFREAAGLDTSSGTGMTLGECIRPVQTPDGFSSLYPPVRIRQNIYLHTPARMDPSGDRILHQFVDISAPVTRISSLQTELTTRGSEIELLKSRHAEETSSMFALQEAHTGEVDIVEFELTGERYAMDISMVREVVEMLPITPLPKTPPYVVGIINLRGEVTHIVDLAVLLGEGVRKDRSGQKIIIIPSDVTQGEHVGIIVDTVRSVTEVPVRQVTSLGEDINAQIHTHIKGIIKISQDDILDKRSGETDKAQLVIWLDMGEILSGIQGSS